MVSNYWEGCGNVPRRQQPRRWKIGVIGGKYFFNPNMQYIMGLIEALGYITSGTWVARMVGNKGPKRPQNRLFVVWCDKQDGYKDPW